MKTNATSSPTDVDPLGCAEMSVRLIIAAVLLCACVPVSLSLTGCTYNRNAPLISGSSINPIKIDTNLTVKDSANGNTVPVSAVP
jgi:hypothetical protein